MRTTLTLVAVAAALLAAGAPPANAQWRAEDMPGTNGALPPARSLAFDRDGHALALFESFAADRRYTAIALRGANGVWGTPAEVPGIGFGAAQAFTYARTRVLLVTLQVTGYGRYHRARFRLVWAPGSISGPFGAYRQIAASAGPPSVAVNPAGDALVAFTPQGGSGVRVAERRAGGNFATPRLLSGPNGFGRPVVALNARGDRVVAWIGRAGIQARIAPAGRSWGPIERVSRIRPGDNLRAVMAENGRAVITWTDMAVSEVKPIRVDSGVAVHPRGGSWHTGTLVHAQLALGSFEGEPAAIPVVDSSGQLLVAYTAKHGSGTGVELANVSDSARIGAVTVISGESTVATLDDIAAGAAGRLAVTWAEHGLLGATRTSVVLRPGPGPFDAPADLTLPGQTGLAGSRVAFSPLTGEAVVVRSYEADGRHAFAAAASEPIVTQAKEP
jgi:hypothetical protein